MMHAAAMGVDATRPRLRRPVALAAVLVLLLLGVAVSLVVGDVRIDSVTVCNALADHNPRIASHVIVRDWRLPRAVADLLVGAALAVAGAIMQAVTRNPLASPGIMGLNSGASFAMVAALILAPWLSRMDLMLVSIAGATLGAAMVYGLGSFSRGGLTPVRLALTGIAVSALLGAIGSGLTIYHDLGQDLLLWSARGTEGVRWPDIAAFLPLAAVGLVGGMAMAPALGVLTLGDQVARGLGQRSRRTRAMAAVLVLMLAGGAVSLAGPVGFIGLLVPHLVRYLVGWDHRRGDSRGRVDRGAADAGRRSGRAAVDDPVEDPGAGGRGHGPDRRAVLPVSRLPPAHKPSRGSSMIGPRRFHRRTVLLLLTLVLLAVAAASLLLGTAKLSGWQVLMALFGQGETPQQSLVILQMRLPRLVLSVLIGAGLAVSGVILQGISRNDLASPDTVGVNAGSGLGMMCLLVLYPTAAAQSPLLLPLGAMVGAMAVTGLVFALAYRQGSVLPARLLLVGIAIGFAGHAAMLLFSLRMSYSMYNYVLAWMSGTLAGGDWTSILFLLPCAAILIPAALGRSRVLDVLGLGEDLAAGLGVAVQRQRLLLTVGATMLTGACVGIGGQIGFLGLAAPHLARRLVGQQHAVLLPAAALIGAILLLLADSLARHLFSPVEIPAGVLVGILGGVYFLYLLATTKG